MEQIEFTVPTEKQEGLRKMAKDANNIQQELGALELEYLSRKTVFLRTFEQNRKDYDAALKDIGKTAGIDFDKLAPNEQWDFDASTMTFKHIDLTKS